MTRARTGARRAPLAADRMLTAAVLETAVRRAGRGAPCFGLHELRRELAVLIAGGTPSTAAIRRQVQSLDGRVVTAVPASVALLADAEELSCTVVARRIHSYRLVDAPVERATPALLDDAGRVLVALYVASGVAGAPAVPTRLVTAVLAAEPRLMLSGRQHTSTLLARLATEYPGLVTAERGRGQTALWGAYGRLHPAWIAWITSCAAEHEEALAYAGSLAQSGAASAAQLAARVVELVVQRAADAQWPHGRPVTARRISQEALLARGASTPSTDDLRLVGAVELLQRGKGGLGEALHRACRTEFSCGTRRRQALVRRLQPTDHTSTCYASATLPTEIVEAWSQWRTLQAACSREEFARFERERSAIRSLRHAGDPTLAAVAAVRTVLACDHLLRLRHQVAGMMPVAPRISSALELSRRRCHVAVEAAVHAWPLLTDAEAEARTTLRPSSLSLPAVRACPRPTISICEFAALAPAMFRRDLSDGVLSANAVTVRRSAEPDGRVWRLGAGRTPRYRLDRADALWYLVENGGMAGRRLMNAGSRLLGPWLADAQLVRRLARHADESVRCGALGALLLLGDLIGAERECRWREAHEDEMTNVDRADLRDARWWMGVLRGL